jgi:hypothetical protein
MVDILSDGVGEPAEVEGPVEEDEGPPALLQHPLRRRPRGAVLGDHPDVAWDEAPVPVVVDLLDVDLHPPLHHPVPPRPVDEGDGAADGHEAAVGEAGELDPAVDGDEGLLPIIWIRGEGDPAPPDLVREDGWLQRSFLLGFDPCYHPLQLLVELVEEEVPHLRHGRSLKSLEPSLIF